ncbi:MAG: hypothetical protein Q8S39_10245, partial [Ignavibacteria bacterium]|nr:hypothetical protein [Ignavibacteria bacterium]
MKVKSFLTIISFCVMCTYTYAQVVNHKPSDFRSDVNYRRNSSVDGNNLRTTIFNSGYSGDPSNRPDYYEYEWPKNTNRIYIALLDILLGAEVKSNNGQQINLVEVPQGR